MKTPQETLLLVVDDEESLRKAIVFEFQRKGYKVMSAENGVIAKEIVVREAVDVVISDVRMPGGDGVDFIRAIKKIRPWVPFAAFVTGFADITLEEAYDLGAEAVFPKPFSRASLRDFVSRSCLTPEERWGELALHDPSIVDSEVALDESFVKPSFVTLGRGGMFVAMETTSFKPETRVKLGFKPATGDVDYRIEGAGIVRWIRSSQEGGKPPGCGIEFESLIQPCRSKLITAIQASDRASFIPAQ